MPVLSDSKAHTIRSTYRAQAVVDWIRIVITTKQQTQFQWIQRALSDILNLPPDKKIHVERRQAGPGTASTCFALTLHDEPANSIHELRRLMSAIDEQFPMDQDHMPYVERIELALDFYARAAQGDLLAMTRQLQDAIAVYDGNPRLHFPDMKRTITIGAGVRIDPTKTMRIGADGADLQWRVYFKTTDEVKRGLVRHLPLDQHRARAEVTLSHKALAQQAGVERFGLDDLEKLGFETLAQHLHFRQFKPMELVAKGSDRRLRFYRSHAFMFECVARGMGRLKTRKVNPETGKVKYSRARKHSRMTEAHAELNQIARDMLRKLSRKFAEIGTRSDALGRSEKRR